MREVKIKSLSMDEFKKIYSIEELPCNYPTSELTRIMNMLDNNNETYFLIDGRLYEEPSAEMIVTREMSEETIEKLVKIHDDFRDTLVELREFLHYKNGEIDSPEAKEMQGSMNYKVSITKEMFKEYGITDMESLKKVTNKFFIPDFLNRVFGKQVYDIENEIDCGL
ncbi:MAG: hypothetical protein ACRCX8_02330 [Sarcina sp.]